MIDSDKQQQIIYKHLFDSFQYLVSLLIDGAKMNDVYLKVIDFVQKLNPDLVKALPDNFGNGVKLY